MPAVVARASPSTNAHRVDADVVVAGTSGRRVESSATSSRESARGSGPATRRIREWRRRPPQRRGPFRPSTSTRPIGFRRGPTACSATSRSRRTPDGTTSGACAGICCRSSRPAGSTRSTRSSAWPSRHTRSARPQTCGPRSPPARTSAIIAGGKSSRSDRRRSASSSTRLPPSSTTPSRTVTSTATLRAAGACACACPSLSGPSSNSTSCPR